MQFVPKRLPFFVFGLLCNFGNSFIEVRLAEGPLQTAIVDQVKP